jgi:hypothetical protein
MRIPAAFAFASLLLSALACSGGTVPAGNGGTAGSGSGGAAGSGSGGAAGSGSGGTAGGGIQRGDSGTNSQDLNPYGVAYPTNNQGTKARSVGIAGNQIPNYKFLGYANSKQGMPTSDTGALTSISLADFYDPLNKTYKLLHISVAAEWCTPCNDETDEVTGEAAALAADGVVLIQALTEGYTVGTAAVTGDLKTWIANKGIDYNMVLDPEATNLGVFFSEAAIPWNADIDVRTMELLDDGVGYDGDEMGDIQLQLTWVENNPPSYACPTGEKLSGKSCVAE